MSRPVPPLCTISQSGTTLVWETSGQIGVIDLTDHELIPVMSWNSAAVVGVAPSGDHVALATDETITLHARSIDWAAARTLATTAAPFRIAVGDEDLVVTATVEDGSSCIIEFFAGTDHDKIDVGVATPFTLAVDAERDRVLVAGLTGPGSFHGDGDAFVKLFNRGEFQRHWDTEWEGPPPLETPNGWVFPLAFGDVGVHTLDRLVTLSPESNPDAVGSVVDEHVWPHLETVVASPDGRSIAWFWQGEDDSLRIRSARLADGRIVDHPPLDGVGRFPVLAIANAGVIVLADVLPPAEIRVRWIVDGQVHGDSHSLRD